MTDDMMDLRLDGDPPKPMGPVQLEQIMEPGFPLQTLLMFLPDVALKAEYERLATEADGMAVDTANGLVEADAILGRMADQRSYIERCFEDPTSLANRLHKRLTGLRSDFLKLGNASLERLARRVFERRRELARKAEEERRREQEKADAQAKRDAERAAEQARKAGAPKAEVKRLQDEAKVAQAPLLPVAQYAPPMKHASGADLWKAKLVGTGVNDPLTPDVQEMTATQLAAFKVLVKEWLRGKAPVAFIQPNWSAINERARGDRATFAAPGLVAYNHGSARTRA